MVLFIEMPSSLNLLWILLFLFIIPGLTRKHNADWKPNSLREYQAQNHHSHIHNNNSVTNITVQLGTSAYLHCHVIRHAERLLNGADIRGGLVFTKQVSWVRRRDWHILSSGMFTYTNDERFQVLHPEGSDDWTLQIKYVQKRDNGTYECQIATGGGLISQFVNLKIVEPVAYIVGSGEHHVDLGSVIRLVCVIEKSPQPPQYVFWYHNDRMINYDVARGSSISVETNPKTQLTQSILIIEDAEDQDSGNYTCAASNTEPASIHVFVTEGDKMAAISRRKAITAIESSSTSSTISFKYFLLLSILLVR